MSSNLTTNITNATLYGGKIGKCFYQIPDEGFDTRKKMLVALCCISSLVMVHFQIVYMYSYKDKGNLKRKLEEMPLWNRIFNCTSNAPPKLFTYPLSLFQHVGAMFQIAIFGDLLPGLLGFSRKRLCENPFLCKLNAFLIYYSYLGLTFGVLCIAYTINRVVLSKELKMNKHAAAIIRKRVEKPALFGIYILQFIIALITVLPSTTGPYYLYCSVQDPLPLRLIFFASLFLYVLTEAALMIPVIWHFISTMKSTKSVGEKQKKKKLSHSEKRTKNIIKKLTAILTLHAVFVIASSIRRLANSRFATYADLVTTNKGNLGFPATEFLLAGVGTAAYIFIGVMDDQFRDVSFWRFVFKTKTEEQRQKDLASAAATGSMKSTKASSDGSV